MVRIDYLACDGSCRKTVREKRAWPRPADAVELASQATGMEPFPAIAEGEGA